MISTGYSHLRTMIRLLYNPPPNPALPGAGRPRFDAVLNYAPLRFAKSRIPGQEVTKKGVENDTRGTRLFHVALAQDAGTAKGGLFGPTDLFTFANDFALRRQEKQSSPVAVGNSDVRNFRRVFTDVAGLTPSDYRRRFSRLPRDRPHAPNLVPQTSEE